MRLLPIAITLAVLVPAPAAVAWGGPGHVLVAAIAEDRLTPQARAMVQEITGGVRLSAPEICSWADSQPGGCSLRAEPRHRLRAGLAGGTRVAGPSVEAFHGR